MKIFSQSALSGAGGGGKQQFAGAQNRSGQLAKMVCASIVTQFLATCGPVPLWRSLSNSKEVSE